jgi:hypothetical protein
LSIYKTQLSSVEALPSWRLATTYARNGIICQFWLKSGRAGAIAAVSSSALIEEACISVFTDPSLTFIYFDDMALTLGRSVRIRSFCILLSPPATLTEETETIALGIFLTKSNTTGMLPNVTYVTEHAVSAVINHVKNSTDIVE